MFENLVFCERSCKNYETDGVVAGFELSTNITYYRGIPLSMVNNIQVEVDGIPIPREWIRCSADSIDWFSLDEMQTVTSVKWEYDVPLLIHVEKAGGLAPGEHGVKLTVTTRTAYIPVPLEGTRERRVLIE